MGILPLASSSICVWSSCSFDPFRSQWGWGWCQAVSFLLCCQLKSWRAGVALHPAAGRSGKDMQQSRAREHPLEGGWGRALLVSGLEKKEREKKTNAGIYEWLGTAFGRGNWHRVSSCFTCPKESGYYAQGAYCLSHFCSRERLAGRRWNTLYKDLIFFSK